MESQHAKFKRLVDIILQMTEVQKINDLLEILLAGALELVNAKNGSIFRLDYRTGKLEIIHSSPETNLPEKTIDWGCGVVGRTLQEEKTVVVPNLLSSEWNKIYIEDWKDMQSEIAIPILLENISVRVGMEIQNSGRKRIGVLNIESDRQNAFCEEDKELLTTLARYAAIRIANIESDLKLKELREKEEEIINSQKDFHQIIKSVIDSIIEILQFDTVNISLVSLERNSIQTEFVGYSEDVSEERIKDFKSRAAHSLDSDDIQAHIIRNRKIEVPDAEDPRLDKEIVDDFDHRELIRVFIPMIEVAQDLAIGTVECGYKRKYREFIYETDVQILESFVNRAVQAMEKAKKDSIEMITHELKNPILGIRNHADILLRGWKNRLRDDEVNAKLNDMTTDCMILFNQVRQLEEMEGISKFTKLTIKPVSIYNEIVKIFKQLKPLLRDRGFDAKDIDYQFNDATKYLKVYTDRTRLNQIIYNLLMNSIKYSEEDPDLFKVIIKVEKRQREDLRVRFQDYGIGIKEEEKELIFKQGFRSREAIARETGSGVGLSVSRNLTQKLGGQLLLVNCKKPTEFQLIIPDYKEPLKLNQ